VVLTWKEASASINPDSHGLESKGSIDTECFSILVPLVSFKKSINALRLYILGVLMFPFINEITNNIPS